jgi:hypothetical protein
VPQNTALEVSGTAWGYNAQLIRANVLLRLDTGTGALFLIAGFLLQLFGTLGAQLASVPGSLILVALFVLSLSYGLWFREKLSDNWVKSIVSGIEAQLSDQRAAKNAT